MYQLTNQAPEGFKINAQGHHVPVTKIKEVDLDRDELIDELFKEANDVRHAMIRFKQKAMSDVTAFVELVAEKYGAKLGGKKGNISLVSFDGRRQIRIQIAEHLHFDERVQVAKSIIDDCIHEWSIDSNDNIKALIEHAFKTNTDGQLNTGRILGLLRLEIDDPKWLEAMEALKDSIQVIGSSAYIRFYERPSPDAKFQNIPLDLSAL